VALVALFAVATPMVFDAPDGTTYQVPSPFALVPLDDESLAFFLVILILVLPIVLALIALLVRFARARGIERQQMKWLLYAAAIFVGALVIAFVLNSAFADALVGVVALGMPIAIAIALFRYRLYDIDLIIRRTLTYGVVVALLALIYFASVILLQQLFANITGQRSDVITVLSTLAIAVLFIPLRNRIQAFVDKRFNRQKYDAQEVLNSFAETVRDETDLEKLSARLMQVVDETMQPASISLWMRNTGKN
jgi:hypothetical protein